MGNPLALLASLVIGGIGLGLFIYGKRQSRIPQLVGGMVMMIYPYFVASVAWMVAAACLILAALWFAVRRGW